MIVIHVPGCVDGRPKAFDQLRHAFRTERGGFNHRGAPSWIDSVARPSTEPFQRSYHFSEVTVKGVQSLLSHVAEPSPRPRI